ncbi:MAG: hypothetical protein IJ391_00315 [Clostridia bacterium]|nr:hypothetical protein [Clostridia bacterium]
MEHDVIRFQQNINEYNESAPQNGIGTLNEHCLHSIIKSYYESDKRFHEIKLFGYVADIVNDSGIIEVQTGNFNTLAKKLEKYLDEYDVTVVYPVAHIKHIVWIDPDSGEIVKRNRSPKIGTGKEFLYEASRIRKLLGHPKLSFDIMLIDMDEYKLLNGYGKQRKIRARRNDRKPLALYEVIKVRSRNDLKKILPPEFPSGNFKFNEFEKVMKMKGRTARFSLNALLEFGAVDIVGKEKNAYIYKLII